jgi:hypothetical protein
MRWLYLYRVLVVLAILFIGGVEWHNCRNLKELQDQQKNLLKPAANR